ncbi:MAG: hypothetical protein Q9180_007021, partial [Flavoplaca navasiana]
MFGDSHREWDIAELENGAIGGKGHSRDVAEGFDGGVSDARKSRTWSDGKNAHDGTTSHPKPQRVNKTPYSGDELRKSEKVLPKDVKVGEYASSLWYPMDATEGETIIMDTSGHMARWLKVTNTYTPMRARAGRRFGKDGSRNMAKASTEVPQTSNVNHRP